MYITYLKRDVYQHHVCFWLTSGSSKVQCLFSGNETMCFSNYKNKSIKTYETLNIVLRLL